MDSVKLALFEREYCILWKYSKIQMDGVPVESLAPQQGPSALHSEKDIMESFLLLRKVVFVLGTLKLSNKSIFM